MVLENYQYNNSLDLWDVQKNKREMLDYMLEPGETSDSKCLVVQHHLKGTATLKAIEFEMQAPIKSYNLPQT